MSGFKSSDSAVCMVFFLNFLIVKPIKIGQQGIPHGIPVLHTADKEFQQKYGTINKNVSIP